MSTDQPEQNPAPETSEASQPHLKPPIREACDRVRAQIHVDQLALAVGDALELMYETLSEEQARLAEQQGGFEL